MLRQFINFQYMACALAAGYSQDPCDDGTGGTKTMYFIARQDIATLTETAGVISAISKATGKRFYKYQLPRETSYGKATLSASPQNGSRTYAHEVSIVANRMKSATRTELKNLDKNNLVIIVVDENGSAWMYGRANGLDVTGGESGTGTGPNDRNGYMRTFTGIEPEEAIEVQGSLLAALETPGT